MSRSGFPHINVRDSTGKRNVKNRAKCVLAFVRHPKVKNETRRDAENNDTVCRTDQRTGKAQIGETNVIHDAIAREPKMANDGVGVGGTDAAAVA